MPGRLSGKTPTIGRLLAGLCLAIGGLLNLLTANAADILLTGADDSPGMRSFAAALSERRPGDRVRFEPLANLPAPGKLPGNTRLVLLDPPSLDWRLQDAQGPPTLVLRISRLQTRQRLGSALPPHLSLLWSDPPLERQLRLARQSDPFLEGLHILPNRVKVNLVAPHQQQLEPRQPLVMYSSLVPTLLLVQQVTGSTQVTIMVADQVSPDGVFRAH